MGYIFRIVMSALIVFCLTAGNGLQTVLQDGKLPSKVQIYSACLLALVTALNDVKSRITMQ